MLQRGSWTFPEFSKGEREREWGLQCVTGLRPSRLCSFLYLLVQSSGQGHKGVTQVASGYVVRELLLEGDNQTVRKCSNHSLP